jgi:multiple sugar transport system permease protein
MQWLPAGADLMAPGTILFSMANMTTWTYAGYNMLIFLAALQAVPRELYEAARLDGASGFQIATRIKVPSVRGAALLAVLLSIIGTIQLFNEPIVMETANPWMGKDYTPMMMAYNTMMGTISPSGAGPANAISLLMAVLAGALAAVYAVLQRRKDS